MKQETKTNLPITRNTTIEPEVSDEKQLMTCKYCNHEWLCGSKTEMITCAGCCRKLIRQDSIVRRR
jgi:hypothetical protein